MSLRPDYAAITPYLVCRNADDAIAWYVKHLGATERYRLPMGKIIAHAEIEFRGMVLMLADEMPDMNILSPQTLGGSPVSHNIYVDDCDAVFAGMLADGAEQLHEMKDQFHGDRSGKLRDPFGHIWHTATNKEALEPNEIVTRFAKAMG